MGVATAAAQHELIQQLYLGQVLTQYNESIQIARQMAKRARTIAIVTALVQGAAETPEEFLVRQSNAQVADEGVPSDPPTLAMIELALRATINMVCPYKALEKQKRFMRCKVRKPADMEIRFFVNHLH
jgi:5-formyltetrahydrofolate cyclo-ligase